MNKPFYTEYVRHALRFYTRNLKVTEFKSESDRKNWLACASVLGEYSDKQMNMLIEVYQGFDTLADNVYLASKAYDINQGVLWDLMKEAERKIARKRGLI